MTSVDQWHVSDHELERYVNHTVPTFARASVEAHLLECDRCRSELNLLRSTAAPDGADDDVWLRIADRIDVTGRPLRSSTTALRVSTSSPLLLAATLSVAVAVVISVAIAAAVAAAGIPATVRDARPARSCGWRGVGVPDRHRSGRTTRHGDSTRVRPVAVLASAVVQWGGAGRGRRRQCLRPRRARRRGGLVAPGPGVDCVRRGDLDVGRSENASR